MLALDIDGTLLNEQRKIERGTAEKLAALPARGIEVVLCSGRRFSAALRYARQLGLSGPIIVNNGTVVKEIASARTIYADYFPRQHFPPLIRLLKEMNLPAVLLVDEYPHCDFYVDVAEGNEYHAEYVTMNRDMGRVVENLAAVQSETASQVNVFHAYPVLLTAEEKIRDAMNGRVGSVIVRNVRYKGCSLEIAAPTASKWKALKWVAEHRGIRVEEIVAIGDDTNDVEMVREAGFGVAVANALDEVKAVADYVTAHPRNSGTEELIELLWLRAGCGSVD